MFAYPSDGTRGHRALLLVVAAVLQACVPAPLAAPEPVQVRVARTPADVVSLASRTLTLAGFEIAAVDPGAGVVTARKQTSGTTDKTFVTCRYADGSIAARQLVSVATLSISASPVSSDSSQVVMTSRVATTYAPVGNRALPMTDSGTDCVSTGEAERRVMAAIQ